MGCESHPVTAQITIIDQLLWFHQPHFFVVKAKLLTAEIFKLFMSLIQTLIYLLVWAVDMNVYESLDRCAYLSTFAQNVIRTSNSHNKAYIYT